MIRVIKTFFLFVTISILTNCSQVLQTVDLKLSSMDPIEQENFNVIQKTLNLKEARSQNQSPYPRYVSQRGSGLTARSISEEAALVSNFPPMPQKIPYKIGIGDTLTFSRLIDNKVSKPDYKTQWPTSSLDGIIN